DYGVKAVRGRRRPDFKADRGKRRDEKQCRFTNCECEQPTASSSVHANTDTAADRRPGEKRDQRSYGASNGKSSRSTHGEAEKDNVYCHVRREDAKTEDADCVNQSRNGRQQQQRSWQIVRALFHFMR